MMNYISYNPYRLNDTNPIADVSSDEDYTPRIRAPLMIFLKESETNSRENILDIINKHKHYFTIRFIIPRYYSVYLLCHLVLDILDILSNELFFVQIKIELEMEQDFKIHFIDEIKNHIKNNIPFIQKNKILPIYAKFIEHPPYHVEYMVSFVQRFHILLLKENQNNFSIERLYFSIDL